ncbi:MAG: CCA tRNA nucleotidyltransferase [Rickettsiales bacterium]|nr:CCA tRNA nucleotidyltransferase [Rickettsiales bacterium]
MEVQNDLILLYSIFKNNLRIVGGAIRNQILKLPIADYDFSCLLQPEEIKEALDKKNIKYLTNGEEFGTITAIVNNRKYEITSTRKDVKTDGRHAIVEYIPDFEVDSQRRDFTFNALYMDIQGNIYDYHNGREDLDNGIVRFIGNAEKRIQEDYLRILRFFRFFSYYGVNMDKQGLDAIKKYKDGLKNISSERIKSEMFKILNSSFPITTLKIMQESGVLDVINFSGNDEYLKNVYIYKKLQTSPEMLIALFVNKIPDWKFSNREKNEIESYLKIKTQKLWTERDLKILLLNKEDKNLAIFNCIMNNGNAEKVIDFFKQNKEIKVPVGGRDFVNCENIGEKLQEAKKLYIESDFTLTREELLSIFHINI